MLSFGLKTFMRETIIYNSLLKELGYNPTDDQVLTMKALASFIVGEKDRMLFVLTGYAGTGKTSIINSLVKTLELLRMRSVLLAPTGRAAKVLALYTERKSFTIHKKIYRQKSMNDGMGSFVLDRNLAKNTYFIVDEASMVSNTMSDNSLFGSGRLLDDLLEYVYSGVDCKLVLVGDGAQLPPVGFDKSPALDMDTLKMFDLEISSSEMKEVVRQNKDSGILLNATRVRAQINNMDLSHPLIDCAKAADIVSINGSELIEELSASYDNFGVDNTIVVVNSNRLANIYNKGIRNSIFFREEEVSAGDMVMVVKNNYSLLDANDDGPGFIANGDIARIDRIVKYQEKYGFRFADMELYFPDYDISLESKVMLDVMSLNSAALPSDKTKELFDRLLLEYQYISTKKKRYEAIKNDVFYNALQIKFAYAVTCHKAQGGQWKRVFIDQGMFNKMPVSMDYLRWLYTALTRASDRLYLVNFPQDWFAGNAL